MEIINIEKETFDSLVGQIESLSGKIDSLCARQADKNLDNWLDNQDVCLILNISLRTLQTYRDTGRIGFSQINHKIYYKAEDVEKMLRENTVSGNTKNNGYGSTDKKA